LTVKSEGAKVRIWGKFGARLCAPGASLCAFGSGLCAFVRAFGRYNGPKTALALSKMRFFISPDAQKPKISKFSLNFSESFVFMTFPLPEGTGCHSATLPLFHFASPAFHDFSFFAGKPFAIWQNDVLFCFAAT